MSAPSLLSVRGVTKTFRGLTALDAVNLEVPEGRISALIGPNGAGKTTLFNVVAGVFPPDGGNVTFDGGSITGLRPDQVCRAGIGRTFQLVKPFGGLTVETNVVIGALQAHAQVADARRRAADLLHLLQLADARDMKASSLPLPARKRLEVARALATGPRLLLLDEVMAGLRPNEIDALVEVFRTLNRETGVTILLIEHVMRAVMALSDRVAVLNYGKLIAEGTPEDVVRDPAVLECYLGEDEL